MSKGWSIDLRRHLDKDGSVHECEKFPPITKLDKFFAAVVEAVTRREPDERNYSTKVRCVKLLAFGKPCPEEVVAFPDDEDPKIIHWVCPSCDHSGSIRGWQGTMYDKRTKPSNKSPSKNYHFNIENKIN